MGFTRHQKDSVGGTYIHTLSNLTRGSKNMAQTVWGICWDHDLEPFRPLLWLFLPEKASLVCPGPLLLSSGLRGKGPCTDPKMTPILLGIRKQECGGYRPAGSDS